MNKKLKVILNILIVIASIAFAISLINLLISIQYANREVEDPAKEYAGVFEYQLKHRAYGEIMGSYYAKRLDNFTPAAGYENLYRVAEYAHTAFMIRVYEEEGNAGKATTYKERTTSLRRELGSYEYTADEINEMLKKAP